MPSRDPRTVTKICNNCGKEYRVRPGDADVQQFCSMECAFPPRIEHTCAACGKPILLPVSRKATHFFCSRECQRVPCIPTKCAECGKEYLISGNGGKKFCSKECRNARNRREQVHKKSPKRFSRICPKCGKEFHTRSNHQIYCSRGCASSNNHTGEKSPVWKEPVSYTCQFCGKVTKVKPGRIQTYCSNECRIKALAHITGSKPTSIEAKIASLLSEMKIPFWEQYPIGWYTCDIFLPAHNVVIECDGDYWHSLPRSKARDQQKDKYLAKLNYKLLRLPESKIKTDILWCRRQIRKIIKP